MPALAARGHGTAVRYRPRRQLTRPKLSRLFRSRFVPGGLYLLDEPEAPLSPQSQLALIAMIGDMVRQEAQFIIATHSPILLGFPGAMIYSCDRAPIEAVPFEELDHVVLTRDFLNDAERARGVLCFELLLHYLHRSRVGHRECPSDTRPRHRVKEQRHVSAPHSVPAVSLGATPHVPGFSSSSAAGFSCAYFAFVSATIVRRMPKSTIAPMDEAEEGGLRVGAVRVGVVVFV